MLRAGIEASGREPVPGGGRGLGFVQPDGGEGPVGRRVSPGRGRGRPRDAARALLRAP